LFKRHPRPRRHCRFGGADRRRPHPLRRAGRAGRRPDRSVAALRLALLGCYGFDAEAGLTTPNLAEAETNRTFIRVARRVAVLADHTKWGLVSLSSFARLNEVDVLITDGMLAPDARAQAADQGREVILPRAWSQLGRARRAAWPRPPAWPRRLVGGDDGLALVAVGDVTGLG